MKRANFFRTHSGKRLVKLTTYQIALSAVFTALTLAATMIISIPIPATGGYVNVGDTVIFLAGSLFGPFVGGISGGLGSMAADLLLGYAFYAPFTFLIKGLEGVLCGLLGYFIANKFKKNVIRYGFQFVSFLIGGLFMCAGYFFVEFGYYDIGGALGGLPGNLIQAFTSVALASALLFFCKLGERVVRKSFPKKNNGNQSESLLSDKHSQELPEDATPQDAKISLSEGESVAENLPNPIVTKDDERSKLDAED